MIWRSYWMWRRKRDMTYLPGLHIAENLADAKASHQSLLTADCRRDFLVACWHSQLRSTGYESELQEYQSYFRHYEECCAYIQTAYPLLEDCTHEDFCKAVQELHHDTRQVCEANIRAVMPQVTQTADAARDCINFIGGAILMMNLQDWSMNETLTGFVRRTVASGSIQKDQYRIPLSFNARAFEKVAGIDIVWTRDLFSHLEIGLNDSTLAIFHNLKILQLYEQSSFKNVFPSNFLDETRRTLAIMLPVADKSSVKWFKSKQSTLGLDLTAGGCRHLRATQRNIQDFSYWRDRLIVTKEAFELSQPKGLLHFWRDDRNRVQWWTFWIAIIVFILTLVGVLEGALQVYKAFHPSP